MANQNKKKQTTLTAPPRAILPDADAWLSHKPNRMTAARERARLACEQLGFELTSEELTTVALVLLALEDA
ncbi:MAG: hypothetical protein WAL95_04950 [Candidatus Acidiferrales bacterium]